MTTQQQTELPQDFGQRVAKPEGRFDELSPRIDTLQRAVDNVRSEMNDLLAELSGFKNTMIVLVLGSWFTMMAGLIATQFIE